MGSALFWSACVKHFLVKQNEKKIGKRKREEKKFRRFDLKQVIIQEYGKAYWRNCNISWSNLYKKFLVKYFETLLDTLRCLSKQLELSIIKLIVIGA